MGVVYLGSDPGIQRPVAIKVLKEGMPPEIKNRFKEEARAGFLNHQNLVTVFEIDEQDGVPYIVMEYLDGLPLDQLIASGMSLDLKDKLEIIVQVCNGLEYAHSRGVVHRDIKPPNVIRNKIDGRVKIVDFGIAKVKREMDTAGLTKTQGVIGTLGYMAPERLSGHSTEDGRIDIYSTGVMLYFLLTGKEPFAGAEIQSIMYKIVHESYPPLDLHLKGYPPALDAILARALAKNPNDRYAYAAEFADDLTGLLDDIKRAQVPDLLQEINRLFQERRWSQTLDKCREVLRIEPGNAVARALRDNVQKEQRKEDEEQQVARLWADAEQAFIEKRWDQAINALQDLDRRRPGTAEYQAKLLEARDRKNTQDRVDALYNEAVGRKKAGDKTGAFALLKQAILLDQNNVPLLEEGNRLRKEIDAEALAEKAARHIASARQKIDARRFTEAIEDLEEIRRDKAFHPELDALEQKARDGNKQQEYARIREQVAVQVNKLLFVDRYEDAIAEVENARPLLPPGDTALFPLMKKIREQAGISESNQKIADTLDQVRILEANSIDEAIEFLRRAIFSRPGVEQFEQLEYDLLNRKASAEKDRKRLDCLRDAENALRTGNPDLAVQTIDAYRQLQTEPDADLDALKKEALETQGKERLRLRIADSDTRSQSLITEGRYDEAIQLLQPIVTETQNRSLSQRLKQAQDGKAEIARRIALLGNQIAELRRNNKLPEAIALAENHTELLRASSTLQEGLKILREELEFQHRLSDAIARSRRAVEGGEWANASEPLDDFRRVYKDSEQLSRAVAEFEQLRTRTADQFVARSIELAKAQTLTGDKTSARKTLQETSNPKHFASQQLAQEWERLAEDLKIVTATFTLPGSKPSKAPIWLIPLLVILIVLIAAVVWKIRQPVNPTGAFVQITGTQPGATVVIDGVAPSATADEHGEVTLAVKPGVKHVVQVSKAGFTSFPDDFIVREGETLKEKAVLTALPPVGTTGSLVASSSNASKFKIFVDDTNRGLVSSGQAITLPEGDHKIRYEAEGFQPLERQIHIARGKDTPDAFDLAALPHSPVINAFTASPNTVSQDGGKIELRWRTSNADKVVLDPGNEAERSFGVKSVQISQATTFTLTVFDTATNTQHTQQVSVALAKAGAPAITSFDPDRRQVNAGDSVKLSWKTRDATVVSITGPGVSAVSKGPNDSLIVAIPKDARGQVTYQLVATRNGTEPASGTAAVDVIAAPLPPPVIQGFASDKRSISPGDSVTFTWNIQGASSATIENFGPVPVSGPQNIKPSAATTYTLVAKNIEGKEARSGPVTIEVRPQSVVKVEPPAPTFDPKDLKPALDAFQSVFIQASGKKDSECRSTLNRLSSSAPSSVVGPLQGWCSTAKSFAGDAKCIGQPNSNGDNATWACDEAITITLKDGPKAPAVYHFIFNFKRNQDSSWKVSKLEPR